MAALPVYSTVAKQLIAHPGSCGQMINLGGNDILQA
jgi:hypothetical protein